MKVWIFSDSHGHKFKSDPLFYVGPNLAGQATAYNLCNENSWSGSLKSLRQHLHLYDNTAGPDDVFMFVLGDIDCRIHLYRQMVLQNRNMNDVVKDAVERYTHIIGQVRDDGRPRIAVLDVPPAVAQPNIYLLDHYGTRDQRAEISRRWNIVLGDWCEKNKICFVHIWPYIADARGWLREEYAEPDQAHVNAGAVPFAIKELSKWFDLG